MNNSYTNVDDIRHIYKSLGDEVGLRVFDKILDLLVEIKRVQSDVANIGSHSDVDNLGR